MGCGSKAFPKKQGLFQRAVPLPGQEGMQVGCPASLCRKVVQAPEGPASPQLQWGINNSLLSLGNSRSPLEELGCRDHLLPSGAGAETFLAEQLWEEGAAASLRGRSPPEAENLNLSSKYDTKPLLSVPGKGCETSFMISFIIPSK